MNNSFVCYLQKMLTDDTLKNVSEEITRLEQQLENCKSQNEAQRLTLYMQALLAIERVIGQELGQLHDLLPSPSPIEDYSRPGVPTL